jgi:hypothetical protein
VDCDVTTGVTATTITGRVGDTLLVTNNATTNGCTFALFTGVITATNLTTNVLAAGATSSLTIAAAGSFTITPVVGGGVTATMTVVIGDPSPDPIYDITFDANGGNCSSNPLQISAASGDWYALPTEGTGSYQCNRDDYTLIGWSHGATIQLPGAAARVPDLPLASAGVEGLFLGFTHAAAADHVTLFAHWKPNGVEVTYDANVSAADQCVNAAGVNLDGGQRTTAPKHVYPTKGATAATTAACTPIDSKLRGWALTGDGKVVLTPGQKLSQSAQPLPPYTQFFARWDGECQTPAGPGVDWAGCNKTNVYLYDANLSGAMLGSANLSGVTLYGANLTSASLGGADLTDTDMNSADLSDANLGEANLTNANLGSAWLSNANLHNANLNNANLYGAVMQDVYAYDANLTNANLTNANLINANLYGADLSGARLGGAILVDANLTNAKLTNAYFCGTTMPDGSTNNSNC